ncbi:hypothetical protein Zmor_017295 [Zophobas morio]|uniref:Uncharacterized protein n=2 Tax=Zophobas morio TaxID=2755281 RepID=A0AA38MBV1_9CUCU|nr:hypothetical protein Zmor_017295 [Zophobas morio]
MTIANIVLQMVADDKISNFHISSKDNNFDPFDDIIVKIESDQKTTLKAILLKHGDPKTLTLEDLKSERGDFSLNKYFKSFQKLKNAVQGFVIFTDRPFDVTEAKFQLDGQKFYVRPVKACSNFEISKNVNRVYKFEIVEDAWTADHFSEIQEYKAFFRKLFLYSNQENFSALRLSTVEKFTTRYSSSEEGFDQLLKIISEWNMLEGKKEKLDKKWMQRAIALQLLSPHMETLSFGPVNNKMRILRDAISMFTMTLVDESSREIVKHLWGDLGQHSIDIEEVNRIRKKYQLSVDHISDIEKLKPKLLTQLLWLLNKCPLIIRRNVYLETAVQLCDDQKFIVLGEGTVQEWMTQYSMFQNLSDLTLKEENYEKILENFTVSIQGKEELDVRTALVKSEEFLKNVTTSDLMGMLNGPCYIDGKKEKLAEPYIERYLSQNIINIKYLERVHDDTIIILHYADNFDKVKKKLKTYKLIDLEQFEGAQNVVSNVSDNFDNPNPNKMYICNSNLTQSQFQKICKDNSKTHTFHYFRVANDGHLEWIQSKGDVSTLDNYKLRSNYFTHENVLWSSQTDNNINLITSDPGTGKSELMKSLKNKCPSQYWTVTISPNDVHLFFKSFTPSQASNYLTSFETFINKKYSFLKKLEQCFFEMCLKEKRVLYVWDALDEILSEHLDFVSDMILQLSKKGYVQWVTSRPHLQKFLEKKFSVLSLRLTQFSEMEQQDYVKQRLQSFNSVDEIETIVHKINSTFVIVEHVDLLGIPIQIFMLTELFRRNHEKYLQLLDNEFLLTDLYGSFIEEKFDNFYEMEREIGQEFLNNSYASIGIVTQLQNNVPHFFHRTFAEYLVATYLSKNLKVIPVDIFFDQKYDNVRFFFDLLLAEKSPAHIAVLYKNFDFLRKYDDVILTTKDNGGRSALHLICSWGQRHPPVQIVEDKNEYIVDEPTNFNGKPDSKEYLEAVMYLQNKNDNSEQDSLLGLTPLLYAKKSSSLAAEIKLLLKIEKNSELRQLYTRNDSLNILYYSALLEYDNMIELFSPEKLGTEINFFTNGKHSTPLILACKAGHTKIADFLVKSGAEINRGDSNGFTPLYVAAQNGHEETVKYLAISGAEVNLCTKDGRTPLSVACQNGHKNIVKFLEVFLDLNRNTAEVKSSHLNRPDKYGFTPLYVACQNGHEDTVKYLVKSGADINRCTKNGYTPLHVACQKGHKNIVEYLHHQGADINQADVNGFTPLRFASFNGHEKTVEYLVKSGAEINRADKNGFTPLYVASQNGHESTIKYLVKCGAEIDGCATDDRTPFHAACQSGHKSIVEHLQLSGADVNRSDVKGNTPLRAAAFSGHKTIVEILTKSGVDLNRASKDGFTPLYVASQNGHEEVVKHLMSSGADMHRCAKDGRTPFYAACQKGHRSIVEHLHQSGADVNQAEFNGHTPLRTASFNGHDEIVAYLVKSGATINRWDKDGLTPLYVAAHNGHEKTVKLLVKLGANIDTFTNDGQTPLYAASRNGHEKVVEFLVKAGAEINRCSNNGFSALGSASFNGHEKIVAYLVKSEAVLDNSNEDGFTPLYLAAQNGHERVVKILMKSGANVNAISKGGQTPLSAASNNGHKKIVEHLVKSGAEVNRANKNGFTPLRGASFNGHELIVECLVKSGADVNRPDKDGFTPLFVASQNGHLKIVEFLIISGAEVDAFTNDSQTPLYVASKRGHKKIVQVLVKSGAGVNRATHSDGFAPLRAAAFAGHEEIVEFLGKSGAAVNRSGKDGFTPLHVASQNGHEKTVERLLKFGAEIKAVTTDGQTPVYAAARNNHVKIIDTLVKFGAEINRATIHGLTPLHVACLNGHEESVKYLVEAGADINCATNNGATPLYVASHRGHKQIVEWLIKGGAKVSP